MGVHNHLTRSSAAGRVLDASDRPARTPEPARSRWRRLSGLFVRTRRRGDRQILAELCATETRLARQLAQHAECLSGYPDASDRLLALAARSEGYRELLAHTLERMGGAGPVGDPEAAGRSGQLGTPRD